MNDNIQTHDSTRPSTPRRGLAPREPRPGRRSAEAAGRAPVLNLADGGVVPGSLVDSGAAGMVRWQAEDFTGPFDSRPGRSARSASRPPRSRPVPPGPSGSSSRAATWFTARSSDSTTSRPSWSRRGSARSESIGPGLRRIFRWRDGADLIYDGPNGLVGWREVVPAKPIVDRAARPAAAIQANAAVAFQINGNLNGRAAAEAEAGPGRAGLGRGRPAAPSRQGRGDHPGRRRAPFSSEHRARTVLEADARFPPGVRGRRTTRQRRPGVPPRSLGRPDRRGPRDRQRGRRRLDPARRPDGPGRIHLHLFLDQELGLLLVFSEAGEPLADLKLGGKSGPGLPGVRLSNIRGDLRLDRLRVGRWNGEPPRPEVSTASRVQSDRRLDRPGPGRAVRPGLPRVRRPGRVGRVPDRRGSGREHQPSRAPRRSPQARPGGLSGRHPARRRLVRSRGRPRWS